MSDTFLQDSEVLENNKNNEQCLSTETDSLTEKEINKSDTNESLEQNTYCDKNIFIEPVVKTENIFTDLMKPQKKTNSEINFSMRVQCEECGKEVCNKYFLKKHMKNRHGISKENIFNQEIVNSPNNNLECQSVEFDTIKMINKSKDMDNGNYIINMNGVQKKTIYATAKLYNITTYNFKKVYNCNMCGIQTKQLTTIIFHLATIHFEKIQSVLSKSEKNDASEEITGHLQNFLISEDYSDRIVTPSKIKMNVRKIVSEPTYFTFKLHPCD
ncbi:uncharacterized protein LOC115230001 [Octopus sinensis]|uniref:Uncharacterized protein LOC115230001 n=1 Tax=Octopus sinensis TaxID=2607531 RepID=A0A6P7U1I4_9MOLL|nr:uncharacterized protein LOC115230001 [Octopus sinensis]